MQWIRTTNKLTLFTVNKIENDDVIMILVGTKNPKAKRYTLYPRSSGLLQDGAQLK